MPRVSPEDLMQLVYDEVNRAIRTTALLVFQGQIELGTVEIKDALTSRRLTVREDGPDSAAVVTANALPLPQGAATEAGQDALLGKDFSTEATLGAVLAKLASVGLDAATLAALESISIQNFPGDYPDTAAAAKLDQLLGKDFAREVTLSAVLAKLSAVGLDAATLAALESISVQNFPGDYPDAAAAAKLDQLLGKDFAREVTLAAVLAKLSAVGLDAATLAALESISVQNFPSDYPAAGTQSRLDTLNAKAFATEPTLAAVLAKLIGDPATAPRQDSMIGLLGGGAREHRETTVSTTYDPLTNKVALSTARKHLSIFPKEDVYWVDSAASDADAGTKLSSPNQRGFIRAGQRFSLAMKTGVTRLDFLGRAQSGLLYVTAMD